MVLRHVSDPRVLGGGKSPGETMLLAGSALVIRGYAAGGTRFTGSCRAGTARR